MSAIHGRILDVVLTNRQRAVRLERQKLRTLACEAVPLCLEHPGGSQARLSALEQIEIVLVSDRVIAGLHQRFMNISGATDVITFAHGEIVLSADTAAREASERGEVLEREVLRYVAHGMLHLNGHEDAEAEEAAAMWAAQEAVVERLWPE